MNKIKDMLRKILPEDFILWTHKARGILAAFLYGFPAKKLKVIGVTGTNGKTTTCNLIAKLLETDGKKVGLATTINFKIGKDEWVNDTKFTTISSFKLQGFLKKAVSAGCEYAIVEVTSHALDQNRVWGVDFSVAVVTNVTREHLDYHETMEKYARAKEKLFAMAAKHENGVAVVNLGMEKAKEFLRYKANEVCGYAVKNPNVKITMPNKIQNPNVKNIFAENIKLDIHNTRYTIYT